MPYTNEFHRYTFTIEIVHNKGDEATWELVKIFDKAIDKADIQLNYHVLHKDGVVKDNYPKSKEEMERNKRYEYNKQLQLAKREADQAFQKMVESQKNIKNLEANPPK